MGPKKIIDPTHDDAMQYENLNESPLWVLCREVRLQKMGWASICEKYVMTYLTI